ncbi:50S ribosomal protein L18 [Bacteriovoracaceae bacterium]|nr:50S ribosomal protein L18 [Bacteriovoracaceae bacterium]
MRKKLGKIKNASKAKQYRRKLSIRNKVEGSTERPRLCATKTNKNLFVQVVDDSVSKTLFSVSTFGKNKVGKGATIESAKVVGQKVSELCKNAKIESVVFDRNGNVYTGVLKSLADSIRENGITI